MTGPESGAAQLLADGTARIRLSAAAQLALADVRSAAAAFFSQPEQRKRAHATPDMLYGYRPFAMQNSGDPAQPDQNESFAYWANRPGLIPRHGELPDLMAALSVYWPIVTAANQQVYAGLAAHYNYPHQLPWENSSYIEINAYARPHPATVPMLQGRHEDGHMLSYVVPSLPGLETETSGRMQPELCDGMTMVVMPGSQLTAMTGGAIAPLYHQVRNHGYRGRITVMSFVNLPFAGDVRPYLVNGANRNVDLPALSRRSCALYGKPQPRVLV